MLIAARESFAVASRRRLPYDAEISYLESTGTQWIDTGVSATSSIRFDARIAWTATPRADCIIFGNYKTTAASIFGVNAANYYSWHGSGTGWKPATTLVGRVDRVSYTDSVSGGRTLTLNGSTFSQAGNTTGLQSSRYALYRIGAEASGSYAKAKLFSCRIYSDGSLVRDFVPVRVGNVGYLYDRVSGRLFANAGTGAFPIGPDINYPTSTRRKA